MIIQLWQRYLLKKLLLTLLFILSALFLIYVIMDLSLHSTRFFNSTTLSIKDIGLYYFHHFIKRIDLFFPLCLMLATIYVLSSLNIHRELVALQMASISRRQIMRPFLLVASLLSFITLYAFQFTLPHSLKYISSFKEKQLNRTPKNEMKIHSMKLKNGSKLIYKHYNPQTKDYFDVYWIFSSDNIWHMKKLNKNQPHPKGYLCDHFIRDTSGALIKKHSYETHIFSHIKSNRLKNYSTPVDLESASLLALIKRYVNKHYVNNKQKAEISTYLNYKLTIALTPLLIIAGTCLPCLRFSRKLSIFFITMLSLLIFMLYYAVMDALVILCENQVLSSFISFWGIFFILLGIFSLRYRIQ